MCLKMQILSVRISYKHNKFLLCGVHKLKEIELFNKANDNGIEVNLLYYTWAHHTLKSSKFLFKDHHITPTLSNQSIFSSTFIINFIHQNNIHNTRNNKPHIIAATRKKRLRGWNIILNLIKDHYIEIHPKINYIITS